MNLHEHQKKIESILPGISQAYKGLRSPDYVGLYTSNGELFNHTFFGRDAGMTAKFVSDFDHEVAIEVIYMLASYQGVDFNDITGEQPGKIHHEFRDFTTWRGRLFYRLGFFFMKLVWGAKNQRLLTYFADDATATYIRLIHKYATRIDRSILSGVYKDKNGEYGSVADSVEKAANWIVGNLSDSGLLSVKRVNRWSLPFQIFQDSVTAYAWSDGKIVNFKDTISYVEAQVYALDALQDACHMLPSSRYVETWQESIDKMTRTLLNDFWDHDKQYFTACISQRDGVLKPLDVPNISAGFTLNNSFWKDISSSERRDKISSVVERLFSDEFLTDVGLRTHSRHYQNPTRHHVEYHDHQTVWPMFNFMVIEGLRRHRLYRLAGQLERRLLRAAKTIDGFQEFYIVDVEGRLYEPDKEAKRKISSQMYPERNIAFTVVPMMVVARRQVDTPQELPTEAWQTELEERILSRIPILKIEEIDVPINKTAVRIKRIKAGVGAFLAIIFKQVRQ